MRRLAISIKVLAPQVVVGAALGFAFSECAYCQDTVAQEKARSPAFTRRVFLSGHSLTDDPFAQDIAKIAASLGQHIDWQQQIVIGSPISWRTRGDDKKAPGTWPGYSYGKNRNGTGLNVLKEFSSRTSGKKYDTLIIAEGHYSISELIWNNTVRYLRHYHERFIEQNRAGQTYLFEPWEAIRDKSRPGPWIVLERAALPVWGCVAKRINVSLEQEGRTDRLKTLPAASALAELIAAVISRRVPGVSMGSMKKSVDRVVKDDVHLTRLGIYYISLFSFTTITGTSPVGAWHPGEVTGKQAKSLQDFAWATRKEIIARDENLDLPACRNWMVETFCSQWNAYLPKVDGGRQPQCKEYFARATMDREPFDDPNPFVFDPKSDGSYWYRAP